MVFFVVVSTAAVRAGLQLFLKQGSGRALSASEVPAAEACAPRALLVDNTSLRNRTPQLALHF